jgi:MFS family permease
MNTSTQYSGLRWLLLLTVSLGYISGSAMIVSIAPILEGIAGELGISMATANNFMMLSMICSVIGLIAGGFLADRFGIFSLLLTGHLCAALPTILMPWIGSSYQAVLVVRMFQGASIGFLLCLMAPIVGRWFPPQQRGLASGLMGMSVSIGFGLGASLGPVLAAVLRNWQQMSACISIISWLGLVLTLILIFVSKRQQISNAETSNVKTADNGAFKRAFTSRATWIGIAMTFFAQWTMQTVQLVVPSYLAAGKPLGVGFGPAISGNLMLVLMIAGIIGPVIAGLLQDKVFHGNPKPVMLIGFILCVFVWAMAFPFVYGSIPLIGITLVLVGVGTQFIFPCIAVYVSSVYPLHIAGKMLGLWFGIGAVGAVAGLAAVKFALAAYGSYNPAISQIALAALFGLLLVPFLAKPSLALNK